MKQVPRYHCTQPCANCPYRTDAPVRHWNKLEFEKLLANEDAIIGTAYSCHKKNNSICVGWLMDQVKRDLPCVAGRMMLSKYKVTREYLDSLNSPAPLYKSVKAMIRANFPSILKRKK